MLENSFDFHALESTYMKRLNHIMSKLDSCPNKEALCQKIKKIGSVVLEKRLGKIGDDEDNDARPCKYFIAYWPVSLKTYI